MLFSRVTAIVGGFAASCRDPQASSLRSPESEVCCGFDHVIGVDAELLHHLSAGRAETEAV